MIVKVRGENAYIITWDWKDSPCWGNVEFAMKKLKSHNVKFFDVESNSDQFAVVICQSPTNAKEAQIMYSKTFK